MFSCSSSLGCFGVTMGRAATSQGEGVGCGLGLKYALIVAAIVSEIEISEELDVSEVTRVRCEFSANRKRP